MNSYLNIKLSQFPVKNLNQSEKKIYGEYYITIANQLFLRNRKQNIQPFFLGLHPKINSSKTWNFFNKVFTFKYIVKLNAAFSAAAEWWLNNRQIGKMQDFKILTLCLNFNSSISAS